MSERSLTEDIRSTPEGRRMWNNDRLILEVTEAVCERMQEQRLSNRDLAKRLGISLRKCEELLGGPSEMTLAKVVELLQAVGMECSFTFFPERNGNWE